ncbi:Acetamidase [Dactylellina cionopaga]|nr:Acetamidase [Dactylellina cionopaga]
MILLQMVIGLMAIPYSNSSPTYHNSTEACKIPDLIDITIDNITKLLHNECLTSYQLAQAYIARVNEVNEKLHAVTEINPNVLSIAKYLGVERSNSKVRGPLHGVPILLKDNIATLDKMNNTSSSFALLGAKPRKDSMMANKLRTAGAIILGKAGISQWADFRSSNPSHGWGSRHGQINSAYYPNLDPSGSSSGSGVAPSIGLSLATLGTETAGAKIGIPRNALLPKLSAHLDELNQAVEVIQKMGAVVEDTNFTAVDEFVRSNDMRTVLDLDFRTNIKEYLTDLDTNSNNIYSLQDIIDFTMTDSREDYPNRNVDPWLKAMKVPCETNNCDLFWKAYEKNVYLGVLVPS